MKTIVILNSKGGVGKSTLAWHLAVAADQELPGRVVMCDTDPQSSLADWWNRREAATPILTVMAISDFTIKKPILESKFDYLIFDTAAADDKQYLMLLTQADLIVIPVLPSPVDVLSLGRLTLPAVHESGRPYVFVLSKARPTTQLLYSTMGALSEHGTVCQTIIQQREIYAKTALTGSTVLEDEPTSKGAAEMRDLWKFVKSRITEKTGNKIKEPFNA